VVLLVAVLAAACASSADSDPVPAASPTATGPTPTAVPTSSPAERYRRIACQFDVPTGYVVECGYLTVKENRRDPESGYIRLAVTVVKSPNPRPRPDPIVYLEGGPGGSILESSLRIFNYMFGPFMVDRDVVLFDQRGIGKSEPALDCSQMNSAFRQSVEQDIRRESLAALMLQAVTDCHERLLAQRVDLSGYTSAESAQDLRELRQALGYDEWNLYGISYGTRLALATMRDAPEGLRSVVLDSSYPPEADLYAELIPNAARAFDTLFAGCAADPECAGAFPDLESVFFDLVEQLNETPAEFEVVNQGTGEKIQAKMSGDLLLESTFGALYDAETIPYLPAVFYEAHDGYLDVLEPLLGDLFFRRDTISRGMHYSVQCAEEVPFGSAEAYEAAAAAHPNIRYAFENPPMLDVCDVWDVQPADPKENEPVVSDIPTLILAGEYDPITPPSWGAQVAENLSRGYYFTFPGVGHGASVSDDCPFGILYAFLDNPGVAPDGSCIGSMPGPQFYTDLF
jgi:pimeloyl-ACP methyl ester carboxylesterase